MTPETIKTILDAHQALEKELGGWFGTKPERRKSVIDKRRQDLIEALANLKTPTEET